MQSLERHPDRQEFDALRRLLSRLRNNEEPESEDAAYLKESAKYKAFLYDFSGILITIPVSLSVSLVVPPSLLLLEHP